MTKATIWIATAFSAVFAACSSSSSNNDGGTKEGGMVVLADGPSALSSPPGGACPGLPCTMPQTCCFNPLSGTGKCQNPGDMCSGVSAGCSGPSDCTDPMVCCGKVGGGGGGGRGGFMVSCVAQGSCVSAGGGIAFQLCDSTHSCPTGDSCMPAPGGMGMFCVNPDAGLGFVRPMPEAGTSAADTGAPETGAADSGAADTGAADTGASEAASPDAGSSDGSPTDGGAG